MNAYEETPGATVASAILVLVSLTAVVGAILGDLASGSEPGWFGFAPMALAYIGPVFVASWVWLMFSLGLRRPVYRDLLWAVAIAALGSVALAAAGGLWLYSVWVDSEGRTLVAAAIASAVLVAGIAALAICFRFAIGAVPRKLDERPSVMEP